METSLERRLDQLVNLALLGCGRYPDMQIGVFTLDHAGDQFRIYPVGLAAQTDSPCIVSGILGVKHVDDEALLAGKIG